MVASSLRYVTEFTNPYVKLVIVCKLCSKEQSTSSASNWKQHYFTHKTEKPHKCALCPKSYIRADQLRQHIAKVHPSSLTPTSFGFIKADNNVKLC